MIDDLETMRVPIPPFPPYPSAPWKPAAEDKAQEKTTDREPRNNLLVLGVALVAAAGTAILVWLNDPKMSHAQIALILAVVMVVLAAAVLSCHYMRVWVRQVKKAIVEQVVAEGATMVETVETSARQARAQRLDVHSDVYAIHGELESLKAQLGDFIKSYPPVDIGDDLDRLTERVEALTRAVESLPHIADPEWARQLRSDLDALGTPEVADMGPLLNLRNIAQRLHDGEC